MADNITYKVLWVDDDPSIIDGYQNNADGYNIKLDHSPNWEDAERKLMISFNEYSAIILDANCRLRESDNIESEQFLGKVMIRLSRIFGEKRKFIPWYVLSAGTMSHFDFVMQLINTDERILLAPEWGKLVYYKDQNDDFTTLFTNIQKVGMNMSANTVLYRHLDVFKYVGDGLSINSIMARNTLLKMLSALYYPEENLNFEYEGNPLRRVLEYMFRSAHEWGLLPEECFQKENHVNLQESYKYLAGQNAACYKNNKVDYYFRYGELGEIILPDEISKLVLDIKNFASSDSHTNIEEPYIIPEQKKDIFFSYVLQMCHIIKHYGQYVNDHQDVAANISKFSKLDYAKYEGKVGEIEYDSVLNLLHVGDCMLPGNNPEKDGMKVKLNSVSSNSDTSINEVYPFFAKYTRENN